MENSPLAGMRVLDLSSFVAGPSCTMTLAQLGADVLRLDPSGGGPDQARLPLAPDGTSLYWEGLNKGKRVARADLRGEEGRALVRRLLSESGPEGGILVTNAVGAEWLSAAQLRDARPDLISVRLEGRPDGGNGVDYTINCETGLPLLHGPRELAAPVNAVLPAWDLLLGMHAALAVLAALRRRAAGLGGADVRISLADVAVTTLAHLGVVAEAALGTERERDGNHLYGTFGVDFATADGERIMVVALTRRHWRALVETTGTAPLVGALESHLGVDLTDEGARFGHRDLLEALFSPWVRARTREEASAALDTAQIPHGRYRSIRGMVGDADGLLRRSGLFDEMGHGDGSYPVPRSVLRTDDWEAPSPARPAPVAASDVLAEWATSPQGEES